MGVYIGSASGVVSVIDSTPIYVETILLLVWMRCGPAGDPCGVDRCYIQVPDLWLDHLGKRLYSRCGGILRRCTDGTLPYGCAVSMAAPAAVWESSVQRMVIVSGDWSHCHGCHTACCHPGALPCGFQRQLQSPLAQHRERLGGSSQRR